MFLSVKNTLRKKEDKMKAYYVIFTVTNGVNGEAYVINDIDNSLDEHLSYYGDAYKYYEVYNSKNEAVKVAKTFNESLKKEGR
jgi:hypothetical protein